MESYARIRHLLSKTWLHVDGKPNSACAPAVGGFHTSIIIVSKPYKRRGYNPPSKASLKGLQWDSAELFEVSRCLHHCMCIPDSKLVSQEEAFTVSLTVHLTKKIFHRIVDGCTL